MLNIGVFPRLRKEAIVENWVNSVIPGVLQCVAVCRSVLRCDAVCCREFIYVTKVENWIDPVISIVRKFAKKKKKREGKRRTESERYREEAQQEYGPSSKR